MSNALKTPITSPGLTTANAFLSMAMTCDKKEKYTPLQEDGVDKDDILIS